MRDFHVKERWWLVMICGLGLYVLFGAYHYAEIEYKKSEKATIENMKVRR